VRRDEAIDLLKVIITDAKIGIPDWLREEMREYINQNESVLALDSLGDYLVEFSVEITKQNLTSMFQIYEAFDADKRNIPYLHRNLIRE